MRLILKDVSYRYHIQNKTKQNISILSNCSWVFPSASFTSIKGKSGAGKSTLLNILGLIDKIYDGIYSIDGTDVHKLNDQKQSHIRSTQLGFLFQDFRLVEDITVVENIILALKISKDKRGRNLERAEYELERVGLIDRRHHFPSELSGGEAQRVALCRAIVRQPRLLLADEPTGNLDIDNRTLIMDIIADFHSAGGTVIMVTHDYDAAGYADTIVELRDGRIELGFR